MKIPKDVRSNLNIKSFDELQEKINPLKGSVRQRTYESGNGCIECVIDVPSVDRGRNQETNSFPLEDYEGAYKWLLKMNNKIENENYIAPTDRKLGKLLLEWLKQKERLIKENTGRVQKRYFEAYSARTGR